MKLFKTYYQDAHTNFQDVYFIIFKTLIKLFKTSFQNALSDFQDVYFRIFKTLIPNFKTSNIFSRRIIKTLIDFQDAYMGYLENSIKRLENRFALLLVSSKNIRPVLNCVLRLRLEITS